ncbi:hypothetical protein IAT38_005823 [Cryptococcus sp. DSM 104549]
MSNPCFAIGQGRHGTVYARRIPNPSNPDPLPIIIDEKTGDVHPNCTETGVEYGGLEGWQAVKIVNAPQNGRRLNAAPHDVMKELDLYEQAFHPNIALLLEYAWREQRQEHRLFFPLYACSLSDLFKDSSFPFLASSSSTQPDIPTILSRDLLSALAFLHSSSPPVAHRDINPPNLMLSFQGQLKLVDFGTAYIVGSEGWEADGMYCDVGTGSYRAPELLFTPVSYDASKVDVWAAGCVIAQFFRAFVLASSDQEYDPPDGPRGGEGGEQVGERKPLFDASFGALGLAASIFKLRGTPDSSNWKDFETLPDAGKIEFPLSTPTPLDSPDVLPELQRLREQSEKVAEVLEALLAIDPSRRASASDVLQMGWFQGVPEGQAVGRQWVDRARKEYEDRAEKARHLHY